MLRTTLPFIILKSPYPTSQPAHLEKKTSVRGQGCLTRRGQVSKALTGPSSNRFNNRDHEDPLRSNKPRPSKVSTEVSVRPLQTLSPTPPNPDANRYSQQDLHRII